ncbi:MAG TPA: inner membrane protein YhjD [Mycobacterium sp.]|nr:inner membrane protein YhjD [Mycobacterium sp.]
MTADQPGLLDRLRARFGWIDRVLVTQQHYTACRGNFYAAGLTYYTIFAIFPLLMVGFATGGFVLSRRPDLLGQVEDRIRAAVSGDLGQQLIDLMDVAIDSRTSVGVIGLGVAAWAGLSWMDNLREALSQMWEQRGTPPTFLRRKFSDLFAMVSAFALGVLTLALTALGDPSVLAAVLNWLGVPQVAALGGILRAGSVLMSLVVSWLLFTWMIARLPRESVSFVSSIRAGLIAAVGFEVFKQFASIYLRSVLDSPAGATFGPVLGLMVFAYITARLLLFATAWAATSADNAAAVPVGPPGPAMIVAREHPDTGLRISGVLLAAAVGAVGALGISRLRRR